MSRIRSKDTLPERLLRSALHKRGRRFRLHATGLPGSPDLVFVRERVAVFVDGDFWHGRNLEQWMHKLKPYWRDKIAGNRRRDRRLTDRLRRMGWRVVRVWERDVYKALERAVLKVERTLGHDRRRLS